MTQSNHFSHTLTKSPILWGTLAAGGFYGLIHAGPLNHWLLERYCASHPVEYVATTMFFVGLASLAIKMVDIASQYRVLSEPVLGPTRPGGQPVDDCPMLLARLDQLGPARRDHYLVRRIREILEHVRRQGQANTLDDQLKYLADLDAARLHASYALVRLIIWAIPILGFLGTVIGITLAIANLAPEALENSLPEVTAGLGVAFDTTALALGLSILLMLTQFVTDRAETALLDEVDRRADAELVGRFEQLPRGTGGQIAAVRQMAETLVQAVDKVVERQVELWQASLQTAQQRWTRMTDASAEQLLSTLNAALTESLKTHAQTLAAAEQETAEQNRRHWQELHRALVQGTEATTSLQHAVADQAETLHRAVEATGQVVHLEDALNRNLGALAGAGNFEQTVTSLAAAIHLLNGRLAQTPTDAPSVQLEPGRKTGHAA